MQRVRNAIADLIVGIVVVLVALWLLRGVFRMVTWGASVVLIVIVVVVAFRIAGKIRGS
ncbi:MAG: hypothetical protein QNJ81_12840 [Acidimicrobiia bacterium]|nr:hypothetical protein [Acidimicrobiia bacterium]